jgi:mono/diheme cytochrome c family protein
MLKNLMYFALAAACAAGVAAYAQQLSETVVVPVNKTPADSGKQMYVSYCASCHGVEGKGNGPVGLALRQPPADLSALSRNNGGKFPTQHVVAILQFGSQASAHGTAEMPVWGPVFDRMDGNAPQPALKSLRISNVVRYIETLQVK